MSDVVVFYSYSGNSRRTAERIAASRGARLIEIREIRPRPRTVANFWRGIIDSVRQRTPAIYETANVGLADRVILCCPIWAGRIAAPVRSWLKQHGPDIHDLAVVLHSGSPRMWPKATAEIAALTGCREFPVTDIGGLDYNEPRYSKRLAQIRSSLTPEGGHARPA